MADKKFTNIEMLMAMMIATIGNKLSWKVHMLIATTQDKYQMSDFTDHVTDVSRS
jgi:hypothetical protein